MVKPPARIHAAKRSFEWLQRWLFMFFVSFWTVKLLAVIIDALSNVNCNSEQKRTGSFLPWTPDVEPYDGLDNENKSVFLFCFVLFCFFSREWFPSGSWGIFQCNVVYLSSLREFPNASRHYTVSDWNTQSQMFLVSRGKVLFSRR